MNDDRCERCAHFDGDALAAEKAVPGLAVMSSGFASVRADDGSCAHHGRHVSARATCAAFESKVQKYIFTP